MPICLKCKTKQKKKREKKPKLLKQKLCKNKLPSISLAETIHREKLKIECDSTCSH